MGKMDLWYGFACHGIDLLCPKGILCFIAQNNWTTSSGAKKMRNKVLSDTRIRQLVDFNSYMVFESASIQTMIMIFEKDKTANDYTFDYRCLDKEAKKEDLLLLFKKCDRKAKYLSPTISRERMKNQLLTFSNFNSILDKIAKNKWFLFEKEATNGIHTHHDSITRKMNALFPNLPVGKGIFVLSTAELEKLNLDEHEKELIKPFFSSDEIMRYYTSPQNKLWIIYTNSTYKKKEQMASFPVLRQHLDSVGCAITSDNKPYGLHRPREEHFFTGEKIVAQRKCVEKPIFSYNNFDCYVPAMYYVIQTTRWDMKFLTGVLNSKVVTFWLRHKGKMQGSNYQIDKEPLMSIPLPSMSDVPYSIVQQVTDILDAIVLKKEQDHGCNITKEEKKLNEIIYLIYGLNQQEIQIIEQEIG